MPISATRLSSTLFADAPFIDIGAVVETDPQDAQIVFDSTQQPVARSPVQAESAEKIDSQITRGQPRESQNRESQNRESQNRESQNAEQVQSTRLSSTGQNSHVHGTHVQHYKGLADLPPNVPVETVAVLKSCIAARTSLAALNEACLHFAKPGLLDGTLTILEARSSAELDGFSVELAEVLRGQLQLHDTKGSWRSSIDPVLQTDSVDTGAVLNRYRSMMLGISMVRERSPGVMTAMELSAMLAGKAVGLRKGSIEETNAGHNHSIEAPQGIEHLQRLLGNWEDFIQVQAGNLDPLVVMAIAYGQLLSISPFDEHNGTVARILCQLFLIDEELLPMPLLNLSGYFRKHRRTHDGLLEAVSHEGWGGWITFFLKAVNESAVDAYAQLQAMTTLRNQTQETIQQELPRIYSVELVDVIFQRSYCRIQDLVERDIAKRQTASQYLKKLCQLGILKEQQHGKEKLFLNHKLLQIVEGQHSG